MHVTEEEKFFGPHSDDEGEAALEKALTPWGPMTSA